MEIESMDIKDKRVDRMLINRGYKLEKCFIHHSPISIWFATLALCIGSLAPGALFDIDFLKTYATFIIAYAFVSYLLHSYANNSIILADKELLIVNPNFPFNHFIKFRINTVKHVEIGNAQHKYWSWLFLILGANYIKLETENNAYRFFCVNLHEDAFDENWTDRTLDDLAFVLKDKAKMSVDFKV